MSASATVAGSAVAAAAANYMEENYGSDDDCDSTALSVGMGIGLNTADLSLVAHRDAHCSEYGYVSAVYTCICISAYVCIYSICKHAFINIYIYALICVYITLTASEYCTQ